MFFNTCIHVLIVSHNNKYESLFKEIVCSQETTFLTTIMPNSEQLKQASIVLYDIPYQKELINNHAFNLCMIEQNEYDSEVDYSFYDDLWLMPMDDALLKFHFKKIVERVIERKRSEIHDIYLNTLINSVPDLIWFKDLRGAHLKVNDAFGKAVGKTKQQCEGRGHYYIWDLDPDEYADGEYVCLETEEEVIKAGKTCLFDEKVKSKHGLRQFKTYKSPLYDYQGTMLGTVGIAKDVTDLDNIGRELEVVLSSVPFASLIVDDHDKLVYANQVFYNIFSLDENDVSSLDYQDFCENTLKLTQEQLENNKEVIVTLSNGGVVKHLNVQQQSIMDIFGNHFGYFLICIDITREKELQDKILLNANTDFLTGLYNRRYFYKQVHEINIKKYIAFVYFDLDYFKTVNDTFGHQAGDKALQLMADLLRDEFPEDLIVRLGGDEFLIAISLQESVNEIIPKIHKFIDYTKDEFYKLEHLKPLSVSAGIAYSDKDFDTDKLLLEADKALYQAKSLGKATVCIYDENK
ncbi:MAG: diguanylate cyclase [Coprobacillus sp.]